MVPQEVTAEVAPTRSAVINVPGRWEHNENPAKDATDHEVSTIDDRICNCIDKKLTNPQAPPSYCALPAFPQTYPRTWPGACANCQTWVTRVLNDCQ
jgi:hypothetical protein